MRVSSYTKVLYVYCCNIPHVKYTYTCIIAYVIHLQDLRNIRLKISLLIDKTTLHKRKKITHFIVMKTDNWTLSFVMRTRLHKLECRFENFQVRREPEF